MDHLDLHCADRLADRESVDERLSRLSEVTPSVPVGFIMDDDHLTESTTDDDEVTSLKPRDPHLSDDLKGFSKRRASDLRPRYAVLSPQNVEV